MKKLLVWAYLTTMLLPIAASAICNSDEFLTNSITNITVPAIYSNGTLATGVNCQLLLNFPNSTRAYTYASMNETVAGGFYWAQITPVINGLYTGAVNCSLSAKSGASEIRFIVTNECTQTTVQTANQTLNVLNNTINSNFTAISNQENIIARYAENLTRQGGFISVTTQDYSLYFFALIIGMAYIAYWIYQKNSGEA